MKIRITNGPNGHWYKQRVGEEFEVKDYAKIFEAWEVVSSLNNVGYVYTRDCEIVDGSMTDEEYHRLMVPYLDYQSESDEPVTLRKYVRIEKTSGGKWYTGLEGSCYELVEEVGLTYKIKGPGGYRFVDKRHVSVHDGECPYNPTLGDCSLTLKINGEDMTFPASGSINAVSMNGLNADEQYARLKAAYDGRITNRDTQYDFVNPNHYKSFSVEAIDMMVAIYGKEAVAIHCECCALKYKLRAGDKPDQPVDRDLEKASWYLNKAKELRDGQ
jgi:hypothetical protein